MKQKEIKKTVMSTSTQDGVEINFNNIGKKYEGNINYTLENVNFTIDKGDFCVMLGPSGCGKTTLLRMIAGLNSVTKGDLLFDGKRANDLQPKDRGIAMVFQSYALYPHMNVYKNMSFSLEIAKYKKDIIHKRVVDAAKLLNIYDHLYKKPSALSGGQRQRVALGRAIVRRPKIFLMDEPLSNLDAKLRETMRIELVKIHKALGSTTIYVTHDQLEAMTMGTKIVLLNEAKIQQIGKPTDLYQRPANTFVAKFIGTPSMNLYKGKLEGSKFVYRENDKVYLEVDLTQQQVNAVKETHSNQMSLGVRTEHVYVSPVAKKGTIRAYINTIEVLGKEKELNAQVSPNATLVSSVRVDEKATVDAYNHFTLDSRYLHLFDKVGNRIN